MSPKLIFPFYQNFISIIIFQQKTSHIFFFFPMNKYGGVKSHSQKTARISKMSETFQFTLCNMLTTDRGEGEERRNYLGEDDSMQHPPSLLPALEEQVYCLDSD